MTLARAYRRIAGSLAVNAPSLKTGCQNRFVVAIETTMPVSSRAARNCLRIASRSVPPASGGTRSSSWKLTPQAPRAASCRTISAGGTGARTTSPNGSRPGWPTVHNPKENRCSGVGDSGSLAMISPPPGVINHLCCVAQPIPLPGIAAARNRNLLVTVLQRRVPGGLAALDPGVRAAGARPGCRRPGGRARVASRGPAVAGQAIRGTDRRRLSTVAAVAASPRPRLLPAIRSPGDLRRLTHEQLDELAAEIRDFLVQKVSRTGGHLGPNLGAVELTLALHRVFDSPADRILWDTGHQAYVHKILTGRQPGFDRLRQRGGLSGYPSRAQSEHDLIENSHASTALSYADGLAKAYQVRGDRRTVVAVVGDGALTGGMCWEALNNIAAADRPIVIVVNDNGRSYAPT